MAKDIIFDTTSAVIVLLIILLLVIVIWSPWKKSNAVTGTGTDTGSGARKPMSGMCWCGIEPHWLLGCRGCGK